MEKSILLRRFLFVSLLLFLIFPILRLSVESSWQVIDWDPFLAPVLVGALLQATLSTTLTLLVGLLGSLGLAWMLQKVKSLPSQVIQFLLLAPSFFPPILVVALSVRTLGRLPTGLLGVVFFHCLMNVGLVSVLFVNYYQKKTSFWVQVARVEAVSPWKFFVKGLIKEMLFDFRWLVFYLFVLYFFSFSIPFLVGGSLYGGIEVFIYEKIVFFGDWNQATQYSLILFLILLVVSHFARDQSANSDSFIPQGFASLPYLGVSWLVVFSILPLLFLGLGLILSLPSLLQIFDNPDVWLAFRGSLLIGLMVGLALFLLLGLLTYCYLRDWWGRSLLALVHPGWVIVGFSFLLMKGEGPLWDLVKLTLALTILYLPFLYRLSFYSELSSLQDQILVTRNFDVPWRKVYFEILLPQCLPMIALLSGLGGLWACGDFALSGLLIQSLEVKTLALDMKDLLSNYRLEPAIDLLWPLLLCGSIVFCTFQGIVYVGGKKILS